MTVHVYPVDDLIDHELCGDDCACGPKVEFPAGGMLVLHNSLDGRESNE